LSKVATDFTGIILKAKHIPPLVRSDRATFLMLDQLLGDSSREAFMASHYLKAPFARAGGCNWLTAIIDWPFFGRLLGQEGVDVIIGHGGDGSAGEIPKSLAEARDVLAAGRTVGVRHAERHDSFLADLATKFARDFAAPVDIHVYATPSEKSGISWHYDAEEVFILQTAGDKEWHLRKNTVHPWPLVDTLPVDMQYEREIMPVMKCHLAAGDWLYIPGGFWHRTIAGEASLSLSVGLLPATAIDAIDHIRRSAKESLLWRQRLPACGEAETAGREQIVDACLAVGRDLAADLARRLTDRKFWEEFIASRLANPNLREP